MVNVKVLTGIHPRKRSEKKMTDTNPLSNLKIDILYKALIPLGGFLMVLAIVYSNESITTKELFLIGGGLFLIGIGEWKSTKFYTKFVSETAYNPFMRITQPFRSNDPLGMFLDVLGTLALIIAFLNFFDIISVLN